MPFPPLAAVPAFFAFCSLAYYFLSILAASRFRGQPKNLVVTDLPSVSILKPVKGCDPEMYEGLRSHCTQDYPQFEIVFGVNDGGDEAIPFIARLKSEFPDVPIRTVVSSQVLGANRKVSNLAQMLGEAEFEYVLINDADIHVPANYLRDVMSEFSSAEGKKVGMVTCLYRGIAGKTIWSKLEAMGINVDFMAGVLTAQLLERDVKFALGSTMATTREAITAIGGLETLVHHLADDYELGNRIARAGYRVVIANAVVETFLPDYRFKDFFEHQLRWGRTVRSSRPGGYMGMVFTFGMVWALIAAFVNPTPLAWLLLAGVIAGKALVAFAVGRRVIGDREALKNLWLLPLREMVTPLVWLISLFGSKIVWRGESFTLRDGKLTKRDA